MAELFHKPSYFLESEISSLGDKAKTVTKNIDRKYTRQSWIEHSLRPGVDPTTVPFFILGTHENDKSCFPHVLVRMLITCQLWDHYTSLTSAAFVNAIWLLWASQTPPLMKALHEHLPMSCSFDNFWLKYSLVRDGASLMTLESRIVMTKNTFVAIESSAGDIFGCFMTAVSQLSARITSSLP